MASFLKGVLRPLSPAAQLFSFLLIFCLSYIISSFITFAIVLKAYHLNIPALQALIRNPDEHSAGPLKWIQTISSVLIFIGTALAFSWFTGIKNYLRLLVPVSLQPVMIACLTVLVSLPLVSFLGAINAEMHLPSFLAGLETMMKASEEQIDKLVKFLISVRHPMDILINLVMIALLPAIGEEFLFRGCLQQLLIKVTKNPHVAILFGAVIFSAFHLQFYGFLPRVFLGIVLGYLYYWSQSIWLSVAAHFFNNALVVVSLSFSALHSQYLDSDRPTALAWYWTLLSALLAGGGLYLLFKNYYPSKTADM